MKSLWEVINLDISQSYTKERKRDVVEQMDLSEDLKTQVLEAIDAMDIPESDERHHWLQVLGRNAGADLLTLGKLQPENMLAMAALSEEDYTDSVKLAVGYARTWNQRTVEAEKDLNAEVPPQNVTIDT